MHRQEIVQSLINKINAKKYLEIGIYKGHVFDNVLCDYKVGVDPDKNSKATLFMTSDEFFETNNEKFDVIFIDGLHYSDQVYKDINNALEVLNDGGYIVCHDMNPPDENCQIVPPIQTTWTGDCWKAWVKLRSQRDDLNMFVVDTDYGCGVITRGSQEIIQLNEDLTWNNFVKNRERWLNLVSIQYFNNLIKIGKKMKTAIIFGITGQDGSHLADLLLDKNYQVTGVKRRSSTDNTQRIQHILGNEHFKLVEGDITDSYSIYNILKDNVQVDEIYNLAAQSHVGTSFKQPALTWDITGKGCINILQAIVDLNMLGTRFYQASSSEMFGSSCTVGDCGEKYQDENTKFLPQSPYAISKCAAHYAVRLFREAYGLHASAGILFNHEGPRRGENFVTKKIVNWIVNFKMWIDDNNFNITDLISHNDTIFNRKTLQNIPKLRLGNLDAHRDWGYAGDYVEAMWLMLQQDSPDDYVICTGKTYTIRDFLTKAFNYIGIDNWQNYIVIDPEFYRPAEVDYLRGNNKKALKKLNWKPKYNLDMLVSLMIDCEINDKLSNHVRHI